MSQSPSGPVHAIKIMPGAVVCAEAELVGDVTIGARTVIHPKARILAIGGPIVIGEGNLIEELVTICNPAPTESSPQRHLLQVGNYNVFEVGARFEGSRLGDGNVLEMRSHVGPGVSLPNGCSVGVHCSLLTQLDSLADNTVFYALTPDYACLSATAPGPELRPNRRVALERPVPQVSQLELLIKQLPNYHHIRKPLGAAAATAPSTSVLVPRTAQPGTKDLNVLHGTPNPAATSTPTARTSAVSRAVVSSTTPTKK